MAQHARVKGPTTQPQLAPRLVPTVLPPGMAERNRPGEPVGTVVPAARDGPTAFVACGVTGSGLGLRRSSEGKSACLAGPACLMQVM